MMRFRMTPTPQPALPVERILLAAGWLALAVFVAVGMERALWLDEANSVLIAAHPPAGIVDALSRDNNFPLYYFLLSAWMRLFGDSEIALRALSALFYVAGCAPAYALGRRLAGGRAGWYSAFLYEVSPLAVRQAQNVRMYSLLGLLAGLATLLFLRLFHDGDRSRRTSALYVAVAAAGLLTHAWFGFVVAAHLVALLACGRRHAARFALLAALAGVPFLALWSRTFLEQLHNGATAWMPLRLGIFALAPVEFFGPLTALAIYTVAGIALVRAGAERRRQALGGGGMAMTAVIFAASLALPLLVSLVKPIYWPGRYLIIALPPLAAVLGATLTALVGRAPLAAMGLLLLALQVSAHVALRDAVPDAQLPPGQSDRVTAEFLLEHARPGDAIVFTSRTRAAADYYFHRWGAANRFVEMNYPAEVATHPGWSETAIRPEGRPALEAEAAATAARLQRMASAGATVWLYEGYAVAIGEILRQQLDGALLLRRAHALEGPFHKRVEEFGPRPTAR